MWMANSVFSWWGRGLKLSAGGVSFLWGGDLGPLICEHNLWWSMIFCFLFLSLIFFLCTSCKWNRKYEAHLLKPIGTTNLIGFNCAIYKLLSFTPHVNTYMGSLKTGTGESLRDDHRKFNIMWLIKHLFNICFFVSILCLTFPTSLIHLARSYMVKTWHSHYC